MNKIGCGHQHQANYIAADPHGCFTVLRKYGVRFYDPDHRWEGGYPSYSDDADQVDVPDNLAVEPVDLSPDTSGPTDLHNADDMEIY